MVQPEYVGNCSEHIYICTLIVSKLKKIGKKSWQGDFSSLHNSVHSYVGYIIMNTKYNTILKKNDNICLHNINL